MIMEDNIQDDPWSILSSLALAECESCGHKNPRSAESCEECGASIQFEDDGPGLNFVSGAGRSQKLEKTSLDKAKHLQALKSQYEARMAGEGSDTELKTLITQYYQMVSYAHEYLKSQRAKTTLLDDLDDADATLATRLISQVEQLFVGLGLMRKYLETGSLDDLSEGFAIFEESMLEVSRIQGDAYDRANEFDD
jgi:hypothetical protein